MSQRTWCIRTTLLLSLLIALSANFSLARPVAAQAGEPPTPSGAPPSQTESLSDELTQPAGSDALASSPVEVQGMPAGLPAMKAVLIVAPLAADDPNWVPRESGYMDQAAAELEKYGVTVHKFYGANAKWSEIIKAARGANFLLYRGDGVQWPNGEYSGFYLGDGEKNYYSSDDIRRDLALARNSIVMIYACWSAGSAAGEIAPSTPVALTRVAQYSDPFFDVGAGGYFANWSVDSFPTIIRSLFTGQTLGDTYLNYPGTDPANVELSSHPEHSGLALWLDWDFLWNSVQFDNAFSGKSSQTLWTLNAVDPNFKPRVFIPNTRK